MTTTNRPDKLLVLAWMRHRRSVEGPPPDGELIRQMLRWSTLYDAPGTTQESVCYGSNPHKNLPTERSAFAPRISFLAGGTIKQSGAAFDAALTETAQDRV